ncbi:hypothetical protein PI124_g23715 [Phytophthora idaei]|nr:hypothetical protein PI124_g23715 [Phytophthora idaei]
MKDSESFGVRGVLGAWWNTGAGRNTIGLVRAESAKLAQVVREALSRSLSGTRLLAVQPVIAADGEPGGTNSATYPSVGPFVWRASEASREVLSSVRSDPISTSVIVEPD